MEKRQRYAIRKFSVGVASVLIGQFFIGTVANAPMVRANEITSSTTTASVPEPAVSAESSSETPEPATVPSPAADSSTTSASSTPVLPALTEQTEPVTGNQTPAGEKVTPVDIQATGSKAESDKAESKVQEEKAATPAGKPASNPAPAKEAQPTEAPAITLPSRDQLENSVMEAKVVNQAAQKHAKTLTDADYKAALDKAITLSQKRVTEAETLLKEESPATSALHLAQLNLTYAIESAWTEMKRSGYTSSISTMMEGEAENTPAVLVQTTGAKTVYVAGNANVTRTVAFDIDTSVIQRPNTVTLNEDAQKLGLSVTTVRVNNATRWQLRGDIKGSNANVVPGDYHVGFTYNGQSYTTDLTIKPNSEEPYLTLERYFGSETDRNDRNYTLKKTGNRVDLEYKVGLTNITADEVELTPDALELGFTYDKTDNYLRKTITLDNSIAAKTYKIGLQSIKDPGINIVANLTIEEPPVYKIVEDFRTSFYRNTLLGDSVTFDQQNNIAYMTVTPFGYFLQGSKPQTVTDASPDTPQYSSNLWFSLPDRHSSYTVPIELRSLQQTGGSSGVVVELIKDGPATLDNIFENSSSGSGDSSQRDVLTDNQGVNSSGSIGGSDLKDLSPYRLHFKKLPPKAGTYYVDFEVTDSLNRVTKYHLNLVTKEVSQTTPTGDYSHANFTLTNADVKFDADKLYQVTNPIPIAVPAVEAEQKLGTLVLNKSNATLTIVEKPDGISIDPQTGVVTKDAGVKLATGVYKIVARAIDGHFADDAPNRTYTFEVVDALNAIPHQVWKAGQAIPKVPVTMENGTTLSDLSVELVDDNSHVHLEPTADKTGLAGYALKKTDSDLTAIVTATYVNNQGESRQVKTSFTYEVGEDPVASLDLAVSNAKQTVTEGQRFADMVITTSEGAIITIDPSSLPAGTQYNAETHTISGIGQYEGHYYVPVTATLGDLTKTELVDLTVLPGNFSIPSAHYDLVAGETIDPINLNIPAGARVNYNGGSLPRGLSWSSDRKTITGTPTAVGNFTVTANVSRTTAGGTNQTANATITITVKSVPISLSLNNDKQTVKVLDEIKPVTLETSAGATVTLQSGKLPQGVHYDAATKTITGKATEVGTFTATFTASSPTISGNSTASGSVTIIVQPRDLTVDVSDKEKTVTVLSDMEPITLTASDGAALTVDSSQLPAGVTYDPETKTISGSPQKIGDYLIPYKATYTEMSNSPVAGGSVIIHVKPLPVSIEVSNKEQSIRLGEAIQSMVVSHSDHSDLTARYLSVDLPESDIDSYVETTAGLHYDASTHTISGIPDKAGTYRIRLKASLNSELLGTGSAEELITLTVVDDPVSIDLTNDRQLVILGNDARPVTIQVPDSASLTVDESKLPAGVTYNAATKTISGHPTAAGLFDIPVTATNAGKRKTVNKVISIDVVDIPSPSRGQDGNTIGITTATKDAVPDANDGKDGDLLINPNSGDVFKKENNTWTTVGNLKGADGAQGDKGDAGTDGKEGKSAYEIWRDSNPENTNKTEKDFLDSLKGDKGDKGENGANGKDGSSVTITNTTTDPNGNTVVTFSDGNTITISKGDKGDKGDNGADGKDGSSITITNTTTDPNGNTVVTLSDGNTITIAKGDKGDKGDKGENGVAGKDGSSVTIANTTTDPNDNTVVTFSDGNTITIFKGDKGDKGDNGADGATPEITSTPGADGKSTNIEIRLPGKDPITLNVKNGENGANGKDGSSVTITNTTTDPNGNTVVTFSDGNTITIAKGDKGDKGADGKDGATPEITSTPGADGKSTDIEIRLPGKDPITLNVKNGENGANGKNGSSVTITNTTTDPNGNTVVTFSDGNTIVIAKGKDGRDGKDGKDGKSPSIQTSPGKDANGNTGVWMIVFDGDGKVVSRDFIRDGRDGRNALVTTERGKDKDGHTGVWIIIRDENGNITNQSFVRDGKDGATSTITTERVENNNDQSGYWIIIIDGNGNETSRIFIKDCGCPTPVPNNHTDQTPPPVTPHKPGETGPTPPENPSQPGHPEPTPSTDPHTPEGPGLTPKTDPVPKQPHVDTPDKPGSGNRGDTPLVLNHKSTGSQENHSNLATNVEHASRVQLPNTGDENSAHMPALGLAGLVSILGLVARKKKED